MKLGIGGVVALGCSGLPVRSRRACATRRVRAIGLRRVAHALRHGIAAYSVGRVQHAVFTCQPDAQASAYLKTLTRLCVWLTPRINPVRSGNVLGILAQQTSLPFTKGIGFGSAIARAFTSGCHERRRNEFLDWNSFARSSARLVKGMDWIGLDWGHRATGDERLERGRSGILCDIIAFVHQRDTRSIAQQAGV